MLLLLLHIFKYDSGLIVIDDGFVLNWLDVDWFSEDNDGGCNAADTDEEVDDDDDEEEDVECGGWWRDVGIEFTALRGFDAYE